MSDNKKYLFYGADTPAVKPIDGRYAKITDQRKLYDYLSDIWCEYTCAPRLRKDWSESNKTLGQCSITAFLTQDIFGGKVYAVLTDDGAYHCYNVVGDVIFDLTSEQFGGKTLEYLKQNEQSREEHFASEEKRLRYLYLKDGLLKALRK